MSTELLEILKQNIAIKGFESSNGNGEYFGNLDTASVAGLEAAIKAYIAEVIGEDDTPQYGADKYAHEEPELRNELRAEQRKRAGL